MSAKEVDVLRCVRDGLGTAQTARELSLSEHTVRQYLKRAFSKLGVHSRMDAVRVLNAAGPG